MEFKISSDDVKQLYDKHYESYLKHWKENNRIENVVIKTHCLFYFYNHLLIKMNFRVRY